MTSAPSITVLVPTIGRMEYLPETRRCLERQTRNDYRVLVLDNASPEPAQTFLEEWAKKDHRVEISRVEARVPMFSNFNRGMKATTTPLVTFFHDDDVYLPRYLEVLAGALETHPRAAFSGSNYDFVDETGSVIERRRWIASDELWTGPRYVRELASRSRNPVPMPGLVFRRDAFGPDGFDESLPIHFGDFVLLMRAAEDRGMVVCSEPVVQIRKHSAQASRIELSRGLRMRTEVMTAYLDDYLGRHPEAASMVTTLRGRIELAQRLGLVWGWVTAGSQEERTACLETLGPRAADRALRRVLGWADRRGLRPGWGPRMVRAARTVANVLSV